MTQAFLRVVLVGCIGALFLLVPHANLPENTGRLAQALLETIGELTP